MPASRGGGMALAVGSHQARWKEEAYDAIGSAHSLPPQGHKSVADMFANKTAFGTCDIEMSAPHLHRRMEATKRVYDMKRGDVLLSTRWMFHRTVPFDKEEASWDSVLLDFLSRPNQVIVISARRRGRGHGGWSKNNPKLPDRFVEFEIDIDPPSLVSRIMSVRDQIANEFVEDLETMKSVNEKILESYFSNLADARQQEQDADSSNVDQSNSLSSTSSSSTLSSSSNDTNAYTRKAMLMLSNTMASNGERSSPYRVGNFDLLVLLSTQESIHRVLRNYREVGNDERDVSFEWFRQFYVDRVADYFDGNQPYGRDNDFLEELLLTPPSFKKDSNNVVATTAMLRDDREKL